MTDANQVVISAIVAFFLAYIVIRLLDRLKKRDAETEALAIVERANADSVTIRKEAELETKEVAIRRKEDADRELNKLRDELRERERSLDKRQSSVEQQAEEIRKREGIVEGTQRRLADRLEETRTREDELNKLVDMQRQALHELSGLGKAEATTRLLALLETEMQQETGGIILRHRREMEAKIQAESRELMLMTLQRYAAAHTAESTTSTVDIPNDEMKGRIIGREGRNIRAFEKETGVDVIIDDTPGVVIVSGFDPFRRETARQSLNKLIADGRIHPTRIEEIVKETREEIEGYLAKQGEEAAHEVDVPALHPRIIEYLGRLHLRTSYSQNVLRHSVEVAFISGMFGRSGRDGRHSSATCWSVARYWQSRRSRYGRWTP